MHKFVLIICKKFFLFLLHWSGQIKFYAKNFILLK